MSQYRSGLIGMDVKSRRKVSRIRKNRFRPATSRWLFPALIALAAVAILTVGIK